MSCLLSLLEGVAVTRLLCGCVTTCHSARGGPCEAVPHEPLYRGVESQGRSVAGRVCGCSGGGTRVAYTVLTNEDDHVVSLVCVACYSSTLHTWGEGRNPAGIPGVSHWLVMKECALRIPYGGMVSDARGRVWQVPPRGIAHTVPLLLEHYPARPATAPSAARRRRGRALHGPL